MKLAKCFILGLSLWMVGSNTSYAFLFTSSDADAVKSVLDKTQLALLNPNDVTLKCKHRLVDTTNIFSSSTGNALILEIKNVGSVVLGNGVYTDNTDDGKTFCENTAEYIQKKIDQAKANNQPLIYTPDVPASAALTISKNLTYTQTN